MAKSSFFKDFKAFISKGNILDMAVGVVIGGAFGKIVTSLVNDIIMPPIGLALGGVNFNELAWVLKESEVEAGEVIKEAVSINYGSFIQTILDFLIVALCIFILIRSVMKFHAKLDSMKKKEEEAAVEEAPAPAPVSEEVLLLREIRDSLAKKDE